MRILVRLIPLLILWLSACTVSQEPIEIEQVPIETLPVTNIALAGPTVAAPLVTSIPTRVRTVSADRTYEVQPGDTLFSIAVAFGITLDELVQANGISDPDQIQVGQTLTIPNVGNSTARPQVIATVAATAAPTASPTRTATRTRTLVPTQTPTPTLAAHTPTVLPTTDFQEQMLTHSFRVFSGPGADQLASATFETTNKLIAIKLDRTKQDAITHRVYAEFKLFVNATDVVDSTIRKGAPLYWPTSNTQIGGVISGPMGAPLRITKILEEGKYPLVIVEGWMLEQDLF